MSEIDLILSALAGQSPTRAALATLVSVEGSSYRRPGARMLWLEDGRRVGGISGGCLEDDIVAHAQRVLRTGQADVLTYDTTLENDIVWGVGLGCQGIVQVLIEPIPLLRPCWLSVLAENRAARRKTGLVVVHGEISGLVRGTRLASELDESLVRSIGDGIFQEEVSPPPALFVVGAGDDARPLVRLAKEAGWWVTLMDSRGAFATRERFPVADGIVVAPAEELPANIAADAGSLVVLMTHRYTEDLNLLRVLLPQQLAYLGVLGPRKRTDRMLGELSAEGVVFAPQTLEHLYAPVGLDLGSTTPETIALSIVAEIQCVLSGRIPIHLRHRRAPIHG